MMSARPVQAALASAGIGALFGVAA